MRRFRSLKMGALFIFAARIRVLFDPLCHGVLRSSLNFSNSRGSFWSRFGNFLQRSRLCWWLRRRELILFWRLGNQDLRSMRLNACHVLEQGIKHLNFLVHLQRLLLPVDRDLLIVFAIRIVLMGFVLSWMCRRRCSPRRIHMGLNSDFSF